MSNQTSSRRQFVFSVAGAAVAAAGIGTAAVLAQSDSGTPVASPEASPQASPGASPVAGAGVLVETYDIGYRQKGISIPAGTDAQVTVTNTGVLQHDFVIDALNVKTSLLNGGQSETITINAAAGTYEYYCTVAGHKDAGMKGTLTVA